MTLKEQLTSKGRNNFLPLTYIKIKMELTELYRRAIVIATTRSKQSQLINNNIKSKENILYVTISDSEFDVLWESGVLMTINQECNALIDDYETEFIVPERIESVIKIFLQYELKSKSAVEIQLFKKILQLLLQAKDYRTGAFFVF